MSVLQRMAKTTARRLVPQIVRTYEQLRDDRLASRQPQETRMGFKFAGAQAMTDGVFEPDETRIVSALLDRTDVFINAGANTGYYCCHALKRGVYTVAVEPMPVNVRLLMSNVRANGWEQNIEIHPVALSAKNDVVELFGSGTGASMIAGWADNSGVGGVLVPSMRLDAIIGKRFGGKRCLVLIDIEGAEGLALAGARELLEMAPKPSWLVEIALDQHRPDDASKSDTAAAVFAQFFDNGYSAWTCDRVMREVTRKEIDAMLDGGRVTVSTHNFLFSAEGRPAV